MRLSELKEGDRFKFPAPEDKYIWVFSCPGSGAMRSLYYVDREDSNEGITIDDREVILLPKVPK